MLAVKPELPWSNDSADAPAPALSRGDPGQRLERLLGASQDGYWERDLRTGQVWYSPGFLALFGLAGPELAGLPSDASARVHPDDLSHLRAAYDQALRKRAGFDFEVRFLNAARRWRWICGRVQVWLDGAGQPLCVGGVVSDVHRRKTVLRQLEQSRMALEDLVRERTARLEAALALAEQRRLEAERANATKTQFLAHMSHEVRTPLNGMLGLVELAGQAATDPAQQRFLQVAWQSGQALKQVIQDVLDYSRLDAGRMNMPRQAFDMAQALAEVMRGLMPLARQRDLLMMYDWQGDTTWVTGHESAIRQIVTNLLGNAIKFTPAGLVALLTTADRDATGQVNLAVQVIDTGPGISPAQQQRVFEAFEQGDDSLARSHGGTGLGLTIARGLAAAMGGHLHLDCPAQGGSIFTLHLRLAAAGPADRPADTVAAARASAHPGARPAAMPGTVWLVYQRQAPGDWLARRIERLGCPVVVHLGLNGAIAAARQQATALPALVLIGEPALHAGVGLAALRQALPQARMRLLIRPDWHDSASENEARRLDMLPLVAPLTPESLRALCPAPLTAAGQTAAPVCRGARVGSSVGARQGRRSRTARAGASPGPLPLPDAAAAPAPALRPGAQVLLVEDNAVNQMVAEAYLLALGLQVRLADSGAAALEACLAHPPALVLMDLQMPGMDGLETASRLLALQRQGRWPGAPIVALTAHAGLADRQACLAAGMSDVMTKPFTMDALRRQLAQWLAA